MDLKIHSTTGRELSENELTGVAGGGQQGGPRCRICGRTNVVFNFGPLQVTHCNDCGYEE
jgi:hypothetical protein